MNIGQFLQISVDAKDKFQTGNLRKDKIAMEQNLTGTANVFLSLVVVLVVTVIGYFVRSRPTTNAEFGWAPVALFLLTLLVFGPFAYKHWVWFHGVYDAAEETVLHETWQTAGSVGKELPSPKSFVVVDSTGDPWTVAPKDEKTPPKGYKLSVKIGDAPTEFLTESTEIPVDTDVYVAWYKGGKYLRKVKVLP